MLIILIQGFIYTFFGAKKGAEDLSTSPCDDGGSLRKVSTYE